MKRNLPFWLQSIRSTYRTNFGRAIIPRIQVVQADLHAAQAELQRCYQQLASQKLEISRLQQSEHRALHRALHDEVTALPTRTFFRERLGSALNTAGEIAVFFIDLDAFKDLNDRFGHHVGDDVLSIVAKRMTNALRVNDVVSRFGGDEFACLLIGVPTYDHLAQMARKMIKATSMPVHLGGTRCTVQMSIGIARYPVDGRTADELLKSADKAMYQAKTQKTGYAFHRSAIYANSVLAE